MPSPSSTIASGPPTHSSTTKRVRARVERARVAGDEAAHPLHERLLRAGGEEHTPHAVRAAPRRAAAARARAGRRRRRGCRWRRARRARAAMSPTTSAEPSARMPAGAPQRRAGRAARRARRAPGPRRRAASAAARSPAARTSPGTCRRPSGSGRGSKTSPPLRGVVVGDEHERLLAVGVAGLGDHVAA